MSIMPVIRRHLHHAIAPTLAAGVAVYFGAHAVYGDRGILSLMRLGDEIAVAEAEHAVVARDRAEMERRARLLRPDSLDPDLLEERARLMLNFGHDDEVVILLAPERFGQN
jgi:cell division protein FtsB